MRSKLSDLPITRAGAPSGAALLLAAFVAGQQPPPHLQAPPAASQDFLRTMTGLAAKRPEIDRTARSALELRFDLSVRTHPTARMSGGGSVAMGPTARLSPGVTWATLAAMTPAEMRERGVFPYAPIVHPLLVHGGGGMVFPEAQLKTHPELQRVDVGFDIPAGFLPEFPPPLFLTTHVELGDVSKGQEITLDNFFPLLSGVLTSFQLEGLRLLVTPFPQQQFNQTEDRATWHASTGVGCFSCHVNGHTTGQFHLVPDVQPHLDRPRIETTTLRGVFTQRTFGSKRNLRSIEDFTEVENNTAYFDGSLIDAERKGARHFTRRELAAMAAFQNIIDLPPAPKLLPTGELDAALATPQELRGEQVFMGRGKCSICHPGPYFTDNLSHDLKVERFHPGRPEGLFKTFPLRGIKDSPPYLHDGRLLTLEDAVEFFDLVLGLRLADADKQDLVAYLRVL